MKNNFIITFISRLSYFFYLRVMSFQYEIFVLFRRQLLKLILKQELKFLVVRADVYILGYKYLLVGNHVSINHNCFLSCAGGLTIGNYVSIGHRTSILTTEHSYNDPNIVIKYQPIKFAPIIIMSNVWVGANVTILSGITIASGTVIGAGSVVTKSIMEPNTIVGGVPARFIKKRI